jgi:hypothetical protein
MENFLLVVFKGGNEYKMCRSKRKVSTQEKEEQGKCKLRKRRKK